MPQTEKSFIHANYAVCAKCKGICCKTLAGMFHPNDFLPNDITSAFVYELLLAKKLVIDYDDTALQQKIYFLRARHVDENPVYPGFGGMCQHWSLEAGCALTEKERPYQCRMLVPFLKPNLCDYRKEDRADRVSMLHVWQPHQPAIEAARRKYISTQMHEGEDEELS